MWSVISLTAAIRAECIVKFSEIIEDFVEVLVPLLGLPVGVFPPDLVVVPCEMLECQHDLRKILHPVSLFNFI